MTLKAGFPSLDFLFQAKKQVLVQIAARGEGALVEPKDAWFDQLSGTFTLGTYLHSVEKMIEAMAPLLDLQRHPLSAAGIEDMRSGLALKTWMNGAVAVTGLPPGYVLREYS